MQKGIEAMNVLEALTSTDNGWVLEKYQVCELMTHCVQIIYNHSFF